jgi:2'-hydroxyisoflavone reductase
MPGKVTIIRPGLIVGPGDPTDRFTYWPVRCARGGEILAPAAPTDPVQWIDVRDLAAWMIAVAEKRTIGTFNALGPAKQTGVGEMLAGCMRATQSKGTLTWVDAEFLEKHKVSPWADLPVWIPPSGEAMYATRTSNARAVAAGLTFRPVVDTARDTWAWWQKLPEARRQKLGAGLSAAREAEVLAAWHQKK